MSYFHPVPDQNTWTDVIGKWLVDMIFVIALSFWLVYMFGQQINIEGNSMLPLLSDENKVLVNRMAYEISKPARLDVVAIKMPEEEGYVVKRIVGLPGELIKITDGELYINGEPADFELNDESILNAGVAETQILLGGSEYFVIGDNWNNSVDSRNENFGNIKRDQIVGKVWLTTAPYKDIGFVK